MAGMYNVRCALLQGKDALCVAGKTAMLALVEKRGRGASEWSGYGGLGTCPADNQTKQTRRDKQDMISESQRILRPVRTHGADRYRCYVCTYIRLCISSEEGAWTQTCHLSFI